MAHTCQAEGCQNPVYSHSFCKFHQFKRRMYGGDLYQHKPKEKKKSALPKESNKRKVERERYSEQIKKFWDESVENKTDFCFFCGKHMEHRDNIHHLRGRTGSYYLDKQYWVNAHNDCHTYKYHMMTVEQLERETWYSSFLSRLREKDPQTYQKQIDKGQKSTLFNDDEDIF